MPVVAIGASAGGLDALERLFGGLPGRLGAAYVVIQHPSPDFKSHMTDLLGRVTRLPVMHAAERTELLPNHVYVIPPKKEMILASGRLLLTDKGPRNSPSYPIDTFLRSLAQESGPCSVAVILSGTGGDGARGVLEVKAAGGHVIVQDQADAEFAGMPAGAICAADAVLAPDEMPTELARILPLIARARTSAPGAHALEPAMERVLGTLAKRHNVDFSAYRRSTLARRIRRRMDLAGIADADAYAAVLTSDAQEARLLHDDLLIGVTNFFRDPEAYAALAQALPDALFAGAGGEIRIWVAGCATGEEVYSVAIILDETREAIKWPGRIRLFATDIQQDALRRASAGLYPRSALEHMSANRRKRYFIEKGAQFRVAELLRDMVVFAPHNVVADPPFTDIDMICCRNVLIYFEPATQARVLALFHFGLRSGGLLFLGASETLGKLDEEFEVVSSTARIFKKRRDLRLAAPPVRREPGRRADGERGEVYQALLERYVPPAFLLDESFTLIHCFAGAEQFLALRSGPVSTALLELLDGRMKTAVSGLIDQYKQDRAARAVNLRGELDDGAAECRITISKVALEHAAAAYVLVEIQPFSDGTTDRRGADATEYAESLERDLDLARTQLRTTVEELEAANEELQSTNVELVASNEELQSTNEDLRSVNEELNTVNTEHQKKITALVEVTEDLENLLHTINVGVLFLDQNMCIRRANARIGELVHILPQDVGRSFEHFKNNLGAPGIVETARAVLEQGRPAEREIRAPGGRILMLNVLPYASELASAKGVVLTIVDITSLKAAERTAERLSSIVRSAKDAIISKSLDGTILSWNAGAERLYGYPEDEAVGKHISLIVPRERAAEIDGILERIARGEDVAPFETVRIAKDGSRLHVLLSVAPVRSEAGAVTGASIIAIDITARKVAEQRAELAVEQRDKFLALLSHELRNPLMALTSANELLLRGEPVDEVSQRAQQIISRQVKQMSRLLEDTLDASRMRHDKIELHRNRIDLRRVLEATMDVTKPYAASQEVDLDMILPEHPVGVMADATRLQQVVVNLTQNAVNHSRAGQRVELALRSEREQAVISVSDRGAGIEPAALPKLFEPFFQASGSTRGGLGLGLSLARSIVRAHGGEIDAASDGPGHGARFDVRLPLALGESAALERGAPRVPRDGAGEAHPTILLIDDDAESRESVGLLLRNAGYTVLEAPNGNEGLRAIKRAMPSVAVVDVGLPDISGLEVARRVRKEFGAGKIRLIALTGFGRQADREAAIEAGCDMHLVKPIDFATLERVIAYHATR